MTLSADRVGGAIWVLFGAAIVYGSWTMDRLASLSIPLATVPGVVPGLLGIGFVIFGLLLLLRRATAPIATQTFADAEAAAEGAPPSPSDSFNGKRVALNWLLCIIYAGVLLGRGAPYWVLTAGFLLLHLLLLDESERVPASPSLRRVVTAAIIAPLFATAVALVFQHVFLVRLP